MEKRTHTPPAGLQKLLNQNPDLVERMFDYLVQQMPELQQHMERLDAVQRELRGEFGGQVGWISEKSQAEKEAAQVEKMQQVLHLMNGRNATQVARHLRISRASVYRYLKQAGQEGLVAAPNEK